MGVFGGLYYCTAGVVGLYNHGMLLAVWSGVGMSDKTRGMDIVLGVLILAALIWLASTAMFGAAVMVRAACRWWLG